MSDTVKSWLFVFAQAVLLLLLIFFTDSSIKPATSLIVIGRVVEVLGAAVLLVSFYDLRKSLTAPPLPKDGGVLQVRGLYNYVRHPMYLGVLLLSLGIAISSGSYQKYVLVVALLVLFFFKARYEEKLLAQKYSGYKAYMKRTPRFIPKPW